jgi:micrococcal nuclease
LYGQEHTVRYIGIDTPETVKPDSPVEFMGPEASERNKELVSIGETVTIVQDVSDTDKYGRILAYVLDEEGEFINYVLVREGFAGILTLPPDVACAKVFSFAQQKLKLRGLGYGKTAIRTKNRLNKEK